MQSFTRVILLGNLTRDPVVRFTPNGAPVASLAVAVNRRYRKKSASPGEGEIVEEVSYFDAEVFGRLAETCGKQLHTGDRVLVDGRLRQDRFQAKDGSRRSAVRVVAGQVCFLTRKARRPEPEIEMEEAAVAESA